MDPFLLAGFAGFAFWLATRKKKKRKTPPPPPPAPPGPPPAKPADQPTDESMLAELGYGYTESGIYAFQSEWNVVQQVHKLWDRLLKLDGKIGVNTRGALMRAIKFQKQQGKSWEQIVKEARPKLPKHTLKPNDRGNLQSLGYDTSKKKVVENFQKDFNRVNLWWMDNLGAGEPLIPLTLETDNLIGPNTREAIARAQDAQNSSGIAWPDLVKGA